MKKYENKRNTDSWESVIEKKDLKNKYHLIIKCNREKLKKMKHWFMRKCNKKEKKWNTYLRKNLIEKY